MNKFNEMMVLLYKEGYEFSIFVKEKGNTIKGERVKFSNAYVTPAAQQILPINVWDLVDGESVIKYDNEPTKGENTYKTIHLPLDKPIAIEKYLNSALKLLRQVPCKTIAKVWIKVIEPKKKTKYPYIKGNLTRPAWWPKEVEHREPDHLQKPDRLKLMCAIITQVLPGLNNLEVLEELCRSTFALSLLKDEPEKNFIIASIFEISRALFKRKFTVNPAVKVVDLKCLKKSHRETEAGDSKKSFKLDSIANKPHVRSEMDNSGCEQLCEYTSLEYRFGTFDQVSVSTPILIDMLIENDPDLNDYIENLRAET